MLIALCKTDPTAMPWSLRQQPIGQAPILHRILASSISGPAPLPVTFTAEADDSDGQVVETLWSFGDGTFGHDPNASPTHTHTNLTRAAKTFFTPGLYHIRCTVIDDLGNTAHDTILITVGSPTGDQVPSARTPRSLRPVRSPWRSPWTPEDLQTTARLCPLPGISTTAPPASDKRYTTPTGVQGTTWSN
jgi:hypothetical protein